APARGGPRDVAPADLRVSVPDRPGPSRARLRRARPGRRGVPPDTGLSAGRRLPDRRRDVMQPPLVSAVIVVLNGERFLEEAIGSVVSQTDAAGEVIVVDDGCTDSSPAIVRRFAERHPGRIRLVAHPGHTNLGI